MLEERFRLILFSKSGTGIKQISLTWKKCCIVLIILTLVFSGIAGSVIGLFTKLYQNYRIASLENDKEKLQTDLYDIKLRMSRLTSQIAQMENTGEELRSMADLPPIDSDTRQVGTGGPSYFAYFDYGDVVDPTRKTAAELKDDLENLERAMRLERYSMAMVRAKLLERQEMVDHLPSISPILGGTNLITSHFGYRPDPFNGKLDYHYGLDITVREGTRVLATANGVVEQVRNRYDPDNKNQSWGKYVLIDHGGGYRTRYCHLSELLVKRGDRVTRWDPIGEVGTTGRSQGAHLHYEVYKRNKAVDPENYIFK